MPATLPADRYFKEVDLTPRVSRLKDVYIRAAPEAGIKPARLVTNYSPDNVLFRKERISILDKTLSYRYVLVTGMLPSATRRLTRRKCTVSNSGMICSSPAPRPKGSRGSPSTPSSSC